MNIEQLLDQLAEYQHALDAQRITWEQQRDTILAPLKAELAALDAEYEPSMAAAQEMIASLEATVKEAVLEHGASVKGTHLHAVWSKPRVSWDTRKLDGLMIALPQLKECRTEGTPSVSIRRV